MNGFAIGFARCLGHFVHRPIEFRGLRRSFSAVDGRNDDGVYDLLEMPVSDRPEAVTERDDLTLFREPDLTRERAGRLAQYRPVRSSAATSDRTASAMEETLFDSGFPSRFAE